MGAALISSIPVGRTPSSNNNFYTGKRQSIFDHKVGPGMYTSQTPVSLGEKFSGLFSGGGNFGGLMGAFSSNRSGGSGQSFHVDRNGVHRPVWQYENYQGRISNGKAPDWMKTAYSRWTQAINLSPFQKKYKCGIELSGLPAKSFNLGKYNSGSLSSYGQTPYDVKVRFNIGNESYSLDYENYDSPNATFTNINKITTNISGIMNSFWCEEGSGSFFFRIIVNH